MLSVVAEEIDDSGCERFVLIGGELLNDNDLIKALQKMEVEYAHSRDGSEYTSTCRSPNLRRSGQVIDKTSIMVLSRFENDDQKTDFLDNLKGFRVVSSYLIQLMAQKSMVIPFSRRPLFCLSMSNITVSFTSFFDKAEISRLADLLHWMGGSVRKDFAASVTHLVAKSTGSQKYKRAVSKDIPIMSKEWLYHCWGQRMVTDFNPLTPNILREHRLLPFVGCSIAFLDFPDEEIEDMKLSTNVNGGEVCEVGDPLCTHLVVDPDRFLGVLPTSVTNPSDGLVSAIVTGQWYWTSIQILCCAEETLYQFVPPTNSDGIMNQSILSPGLPSPLREGKRASSTSLRLSLGRSRQLKRQTRSLRRESLEMLGNETSCNISASNLGSPNSLGMSPGLSGSPLNSYNYSRTTPADLLRSISTEDLLDEGRYTEESEKLIVAPSSKRYMVISELVTTETNYVKVLDTVMSIKHGVENPSQQSGSILNEMDVESIWGKLPVIREIHTSLLSDLKGITDPEKWDEATSVVGDIILRHADAFDKNYGPFVNFFDSAKEAIARLDRINPRFHAFLKVCQTRADCGRQTLSELLIRPVQRLPSLLLLLGDIIKNTPDAHPDKALLRKADEHVKIAVSHINEGRRQTETYVTMLNVFHSIENAPPTLLNSTRSLLKRVDCIDLSPIGPLSVKRPLTPITLFIFSDSVAGAFPSTTSVAGAAGGHPGFKHLAVVSLQSVRRVLDLNCILDEESPVRGAVTPHVIGLVVRDACDSHTSTYLLAFQLGPHVSIETKRSVLDLLAKQISISISKTDYFDLLTEVNGVEFDIEPIRSTTIWQNANANMKYPTIAKVFHKFASKNTRKRVSRASSFNDKERGSKVGNSPAKEEGINEGKDVSMKTRAIQRTESDKVSSGTRNGTLGPEFLTPKFRKAMTKTFSQYLSGSPSHSESSSTVNIPDLDIDQDIDRYTDRDHSDNQSITSLNMGQSTMKRIGNFFSRKTKKNTMPSPTGSYTSLNLPYMGDETYGDFVGAKSCRPDIAIKLPSSVDVRGVKTKKQSSRRRLSTAAHQLFLGPKKEGRMAVAASMSNLNMAAPLAEYDNEMPLNNQLNTLNTFKPMNTLEAVQKTYIKKQAPSIDNGDYENMPPPPSPSINKGRSGSIHGQDAKLAMFPVKRSAQKPTCTEV